MFDYAQGAGSGGGADQAGNRSRASGPRPGAVDVLDRLRAVLDELAETDPTVLSDSQAVAVLARQSARLDAVWSRSVAAFEGTGEWAQDGALKLGSWLATRFRLPLAEARRRVRAGRALKDLPLAAQAWLDGDITASHMAKLLSVRNGRTEAAMAEHESLLVDKAKTLRFDHFEKVIAYWHGLADPDGSDDSAEGARRRRDAYLVKSFEGMFIGKMTLDPISGAIVSDEWERLERELFEVDWKEAKERLGRDPDGCELSRTPAQRRVDALVEMAARSRTAPVDGVRPRPLFTVLVGYETLHGRICELANGRGVLDPRQLLPWLDQALVERAVFGPKNRVEVSTTARLFTGATRRAVEVRDHRGCTHPYCFAPASRCQVDHIVPWEQGGLTTQENGRLACPAHNRSRNSRPDPPDWSGPTVAADHHSDEADLDGHTGDQGPPR